MEDSLGICHDLVRDDFIERSLYRRDIMKGGTLESLILDEINELQRDLLKAVDP